MDRACATSCVCHLCRSVTTGNAAVALFSKKSSSQQLSSRISNLLDIDLPSQSDGIPPYVCCKCSRRFQRLEKAASELADFRQLAKENQRHFQLQRKRPKETSGALSVTPDTARARPPAKRRVTAGGRRLDFESMTDGKSIYALRWTAMFTFFHLTENVAVPLPIAPSNTDTQTGAGVHSILKCPALFNLA